MKKIILVLCMLTCLFSLTACSNNSNSKTQEASEYITKETMNSISMNLVDQLSLLSKDKIQKMIDMPNIQISGTAEEAIVYKGFYKAWLNTISQFGSYMETEDFEYSVDGHDVFGKMTLVFENGTAEFIITASEESMTVTSLQLTQNQTLGDKMKKAGLNTLMGMGIVFIVLIFIAFLISLFKYINKAEAYFEKRKSEKEARTTEDMEIIDASNAPFVLDIVPEMISETDELELAAVITAAIAASLNTSVDKLVVRSIKRRDSNQWQRNY